MTSRNPFADQGDWLDRKRAECLADLARLKLQLDTIAPAPWEERPERMNSLLRQAAGAFRSLERFDELQQTWVDPNADR